MKNTKRFSIIFTSLILAVTLSAGSFAAMTNGVEPPVAVAKAEAEAEITGDVTDFEDVYEEIPESEDLPLVEMSFNLPSEMNGVYLVPGEDFLKSTDDSADTVKKQIDDALEAAVSAKINTVIIDTVYGEKVIYLTKDSEPKFEDIDLAGYITEKSREKGLYVYAIFDASSYDTLEKLDANISEFAEKHMLDGILIDGYEGKPDDSGYTEYIKSGSSMGYDNYKNQTAAGIVKTASKAIRKAAPETQAGLLANPVWANIADNKNGSATTAEYTSLVSGFADTRMYIELGWFDFVAVKADKQTTDTAAPFGEIVSWWGDLATTKSIPLYFVYPSGKIGKDGWTSTSIVEQISFALGESAYNGAIYDSLKNIPGSAADAAAPAPTVAAPTDAASLVKPIPAAPAPAVTETSAPAPSSDPISDEEELWTDFESEEDEYIEDESSSSNGDIIKSISPMGIVTGEYGDDIEITVVALKDSSIMATLNGETVHLSRGSGYGSDPKYAYFSGVYTVSDDDYDDDGGDGDLFLGALSVYANCGDRDEIFDGAYFAAAKTANSRYPVQVTADQARTYPTSTKNCTPVPSMYPLPKGSIDYAIGKPVTVKNDSGVKFSHLILESGVRVDSKDVKEIKSGPGKNSVVSLSVSEKSGYTYISLGTKQKVTYSVSYTGKEFIVTFNNTTIVPNTKSLKSNKMFSKATWSGKNKLVLTLKKTGSFMGFKGYYDGSDLVFRFNNPPSSIKNAKIYVDPGHGGSDTGVIGKNPTVYEKDITIAIAKKLAAELKARGATVKMYDQSQNIKAPERVVEAEKWGADLLVSVHCNSAANTSAKGTEVYYFYPYSQRLAINTSLNASKQFAGDNRGAKASYYNITLSPQMSSALVETAFVTNKSDYSKLLKASYHQKLAVGIANGIEGAIKAAYTGTASNGTEFKSPGTSAPISDDDDFGDIDSTDSSSKLTSLSFSEELVQIKIGESITLKPTHKPTSVKNPPLLWKTSNTATVSVDDSGKITGNRAGFTTITVTADDGSKKKATIRVQVLNEVVLAPTPVDVSGIELRAASDPFLDEDYIMIYPGNKQRIEIFSDDGRLIRGKDFKWKSDDTKVATVDANGIVTGKAVGYAIITATGGGYTFECEIETSKTTVAVKGVSLDETDIIMVRNTSKALVAAITPKNATNKGITWTSSNSKIAEVNSNGVIVAKNAGKVTITAKTKSGGYKATCNVEVLNKGIDLEEIEVDFESFEMSVGSTDMIYVEHYPSDTTADRGLTFKSSNSNVVSVDSEGNVTALKKGTAKITVTSKANSKITATCTIKVV